MPAKAAPKPRSKTTADHVSYQDMIIDAIVTLKERNGSSRIALKKYIKANNKNIVDGKMFDSLFNRALKSGVEKGIFAQPKGASGGTKLAKKVPKPSKPVVKSTESKAGAEKKSTEKKAVTKKNVAAKKATSLKSETSSGSKTAKSKVPAKSKKSTGKDSSSDKTAALSRTKSGRVTKATPADKKAPAKKKTPVKKTVTKKTASS